MSEINYDIINQLGENFYRLTGVLGWELSSREDRTQELQWWELIRHDLLYYDRRTGKGLNRFKEEIRVNRQRLRNGINSDLQDYFDEIAEFLNTQVYPLQNILAIEIDLVHSQQMRLSQPYTVRLPASFYIFPTVRKWNRVFEFIQFLNDRKASLNTYEELLLKLEKDLKIVIEDTNVVCEINKQETEKGLLAKPSFIGLFGDASRASAVLTVMVELRIIDQQGKHTLSQRKQYHIRAFVEALRAATPRLIPMSTTDREACLAISEQIGISVDTKKRFRNEGIVDFDTVRDTFCSYLNQPHISESLGG